VDPLYYVICIDILLTLTRNVYIHVDTLLNVEVMHFYLKAIVWQYGG